MSAERGPSASPRTNREATRAPKLAAKTSGSIANAQIIAKTMRTVRGDIHLFNAPATQPPMVKGRPLDQTAVGVANTLLSPQTGNPPIMAITVIGAVAVWL